MKVSRAIHRGYRLSLVTTEPADICTCTLADDGEVVEATDLQGRAWWTPVHQARKQGLLAGRDGLFWYRGDQ